MMIILAALFLVASFNLIAAECPNACSAHGKCGAFDMCTCYRNWMANDCSERICQFGLAHVDTPKGDLDSSGHALSGPGTVVATNSPVYPWGTTELFPATMDSKNNVIDNTAHYYQECSNKGLCDRTTGDCQCFEGYAGSACQRADCPTTNGAICSGHGTCETISTIAKWDNNNIYNLWDEHSTMGCVCDPGFQGPDCSQQMCKFGVDPLYPSDQARVRYSNYTFQIYADATSASISAPGTVVVTGNYSITFYDSFGEDWSTMPIDINADCDVITSIVEALPQNVIPADSVRCQRDTGSFSDLEITLDGSVKLFTRYTLAFSQNFGRLQQPEINVYLDGTRPTLFTNELGPNTLGWHVYPNGYIGEYDDLVPDLCEGVQVTINWQTTAPYGTANGFDSLTAGDAQQTKALKRCLGDADGKSSSFASEVYQWDWGTINNPHLIKLTEATQDFLVAGASLTKNPGYPWQDPAQKDYAVTRLCTSMKARIVKESGDIHVANWCVNENPAGFYAVIYYDGYYFRVLTRGGIDYASGSQKFNVFTTQGWLQLVNPNSIAFTHSLPTLNAYQQRAMSHSNIIYLANNSAPSSNYDGQLDCETNPIGTDGALDCLNKNDYVMIFNNFVQYVKTTVTGLSASVAGDATVGLLDATKNLDLAKNGYANNPQYPNIYKVAKIFRNEKTYNNPSVNPQNEVFRHQIVLDYGMNVRYDHQFQYAQVYKFHPVSAYGNVSSYNYVGQCSNRGVCDFTSGVCQCFPGYTGDNCGTQNALAKA